MARIKRKVLRKIIVYGISLLLVGGLAAAFFRYQNRREEERLAQAIEQEEDKALEAAEEGQLKEALRVMDQEEMEELYDQHKVPKIQETEVPVYSSPIDFEGMWEVNKDVYAWITIPGTAIDYPILQHETDNTYYLNYNIDGSYGYPGCIYTENMNKKDFTDNNTIIYGHNMKNGTMFADLHKYENSAFLEENNQIYIYLPDKELHYTIFAAYVYDDRHLMYSFNFSDSAVYENYLESVFAIRSMNANIRDDISVTKEDKIITLVTCIASQPDKRLLVQAVLQTE